MFPSRWPMYEKRFIIYKRKVSHLNKRVLPARRMVLHLKKESISYPEGGFFIPIRKVIQSSISWIHLRQRGNSFESKRWLIVEKEELHSFMASSRDVLPWNLQFKPFLGKSCPSSILERWYHLSEQFKHVGKKCIDSFQRPFPKPRLCICPRNAKHCDLAATFLKRWKNMWRWYISNKKAFCLPKPVTDAIPFRSEGVFFNSVVKRLLYPKNGFPYDF